MSSFLKKEKDSYNYGDYLNWSEDERWELIQGIPYLMTPAPSRRSQEVLGELFAELRNYLKDKSCRVYLAPFDVRLPAKNEKDEDIKTIVQPDITVVCDHHKLDDKGCKGAPDLIVEIVSPSSAAMDYIKKLALYEKNGVKEYWIVHPLDKIVTVYKLLNHGQYGRPEIYDQEGKIKVEILGDLILDLKSIFPEEMEQTNS